MVRKHFLIIVDIIKIMLIVNRSKVLRISLRVRVIMTLMGRVIMILDQNPKRRMQSALIAISKGILHEIVGNLVVGHINAVNLMIMELILAE